MKSCSACAAEFGPKFREFTCSRCQSAFCGGHLIPAEQMTLHSYIMPALSGGQGLCLQCILEIWSKTDSDLKAPQGIIGRAKSNLTATWKALSDWITREPDRVELIKVSDSAFESLNSSRALAIFRHQRSITQEEIIKELTAFARIYAVSQGRDTEKSIALTDVYRLIDWMRTHPRIPEWAHGVSWSLIESSPSYMAHITDVWQVAKTAIALSNPLTAGSAIAVYYVSDRALDQAKGKGLLATGYESVKDIAGLNINVKMALLSYFGGLFVMQVLKRKG